MKNPLVTQEMVRRMARRRRWWRRIRRALAVVCSLLVLGALAYGVDRLVVLGHRLYAEDVEHHGAPIVPTESTSVPTTTTTTAPGPPPCTSPQLDAYLDHWQIVGATLYEIVVLDDTSAALCSLTGYPALAVSGPDGSAPPAPVDDVATLGAVAGPGTATPVDLDPGSQAWFEVSYSVSCSVVLRPFAPATGAPGQCYEGSELEITPPHATSPLAIAQPLGFTYGTAGFQVGPFQGGPLPASPPLG